MGGWWGGRRINLHTDTLEYVAVAIWDSYKAPTYHFEEMFEQWQHFQVIAPKWYPLEKILTVTSQGQEMPSRKADQLTLDGIGTVHG